MASIGTAYDVLSRRAFSLEPIARDLKEIKSVASRYFEQVLRTSVHIRNLSALVRNAHTPCVEGDDRRIRVCLTPNKCATIIFAKLHN